MKYIIESICHEENVITIYERSNLKDANKFAQFLRDTYNVDVDVYTASDYNKLHEIID